jgi:Putative DNA-binding domain
MPVSTLNYSLVQRGATTWDQIGDTVTMWPSKPDEQENFLRDLILTGVENEKLDFKSQFHFTNAVEKVKILKHLSAIANSDFEDFGGFGFIIFGAARGALIGGIQAFDPISADNTSSILNTEAHNYLAPSPRFQLVNFMDAQLGAWGAIVIPPSETQPHMFVRQLDGQISPGDWFVRAGDNTRQALHADYLRILNKSVTRAVQPLQSEVTKLTERVSQLEGRLGELQDRQPLVEFELLNPFNGEPLEVVDIAEISRNHYQTEFMKLKEKIQRATKIAVQQMEKSKHPQSDTLLALQRKLTPMLGTPQKREIKPNEFNTAKKVLHDLEVTLPEGFFMPVDVSESRSILEVIGHSSRTYSGASASWFCALQELNETCEKYFEQNEQAEAGHDFLKLVFSLKNTGKGPLEGIELQVNLEPLENATNLKISYSDTPPTPRYPGTVVPLVSPLGGLKISKSGQDGWWDLGTLQPKADLEPKFGFLNRMKATGRYFLHVKVLANNLPDPFERSYEIIC